ncbi:MAG: hypothetical protein ABEJ03_01585 [Candidatus Nanohaloarchaea archaeon]
MRVERLLIQLKREFIKVNVLQAMLDTLIFFLATNLVLFVTNVQIFSSVKNIYAITGFALVFGTLDLYYRTKQYHLEMYEEENPELKEILRTARDNLDERNIVSQALFDDLLDRARRVTSESIVPAKQIIYKTLAVGALSFLTVMSGLADFQVGGNTDLFQTPDDIQDIVGEGEENKSFELKNNSDIYGEESEIDPSDMEVDFSVEGEGSAEATNATDSGGESERLRLDATKSYEKDLELAKRYSLAIKDLG